MQGGTVGGGEGIPVPRKGVNRGERRDGEDLLFMGNTNREGDWGTGRLDHLG